MPTYVHTVAHSGAETINGQLDGTAVAKVGPSGVVKAAFGGSKAETTAVLKLREGGREIIPPGSHPNVLGAADSISIQSLDFIYEERGLPPGAEIELEIVAAAAAESSIAIRTF